jgi:hypothetical protein
MDLTQLKTAVIAAGFPFGKTISREYVTEYPVGYVNEAGENRKAWATWHPTKTEKATHIPQFFDTQTFKPLQESDFHLPLELR